MPPAISSNAGCPAQAVSPYRCEVVLGELLKEIKKNPSSVKFAEMANILVIHCQTTGESLRVAQGAWGRTVSNTQG